MSAAPVPGSSPQDPTGEAERRGDPNGHLSFSDSTADVIGAFIRDRSVAGDSGPLPYVFVDSVTNTVAKVTAAGGEVVKEPYHEPPDTEEHLTVATFRDLAGNVIGIWHTGG
jgi:predicted enzyme related to lactoylglutathione lyase